MGVVDIAILVLLAVSLIKGLLRGLLKEVCSLAGLVVGGFLAFRFHAPLAEWMIQSFDLPAKLCVVAAFLALFLSALVAFSALGFLLSRLVKLVFLGGFNRVAGGLFGLAEGVLLLAVVLYGLSFAKSETVAVFLRGSQLAPPFVKLGEAAFHGSLETFAERR
ncbi:MAG: colicin V production protein [Desulfuromonas sp.]|uniref:CvpA family protein n=1 Tax=Desulfuromonas sp. TaxID=892 RepID=UPI000CBC570B|nr:CvpA family protein [Desulfuromonas sp.]PLX83861.1 MAG: colicin V production protein [Desulfuromonas sp.]